MKLERWGAQSMELEFNPILKILKIRTIPKGIHLSFDK